MIRFLADENFDNDIIRGILRRRAGIDIIRVQDIGLSSVSDEIILNAAAEEGRILLTHDVKTVTAIAFARVKEGLPMSGVLEVRKNLPLGSVIEDLLVLDELSLPEDWEGQVRFLPLK